MPHKRIVLGAVAAIVAVAALAGGALALTGGGSSVPADVRAPVASGEVAGALSASISTLATDPVSLDGHYDYVQLAQAGGNLAAARKARTTPSGGEVFLVPSDGGACLTSRPLLEAGCFSSADLTDGVTASSIICSPSLAPETIEVYGTAPDGVDTVTVKRDDGSSLSVDVVGDVYIYTAPVSDPRPLTVTWTKDGTAGAVDASVPADFRDGRCATPQQLDAARAQKQASPPSGGPSARATQDAERGLRSRR